MIFLNKKHIISKTIGETYAFKGKHFDWGKTSEDYAKHRPGYPDSFYQILYTMGIGIPDQQILDLGTGVGELAIHFALQGADVTGVDIAEPQIIQAKNIAQTRNLYINFMASPVEQIDFPPEVFDVITASMCWIYFDKTQLMPIIKNILRPEGVVLIASMIWLPFEDEVVEKTENIVLKHNPTWNGAAFRDNFYPTPEWLEIDLPLYTFRKYKENIEFTHESWRGRIRACRGAGASLPKNEIHKIDMELKEYLRNNVPDPFEVKHLIMFQIFRNI